MAKLKKIHLLTGANLGDRFSTLEKAAQLLSTRVGEILNISSLYETEPWGNVDQPGYLNQALEMETPLSPAQLLRATQQIENELGRTRQVKWEARLIDIDILFYENKIIESPGLTVPHPHLHRRNFVLVPMLEIAPLKEHPVFKKTIEDLYEASEDGLEVQICQILRI
ncbi:MAG TPA: 2-amino-4-hydroxy-6-hydroxymethyldihydropteridine diphosphokinase [Bacteroidetes bacterium]|nr:2-amino-4-hydroxy-6-hydroxymethyldihydropteridine diphosphokinase [Bacteroidota bacterium]